MNKLFKYIIIVTFLFCFINVKASSFEFVSKNNDGDFMNDITFKLKDLNDKDLISIIKNTDSVYGYDNEISFDYNKAYSLLNNNQKNIISNIRTINKEEYKDKTFKNELEFIQNTNGMYMNQKDNVIDIYTLVFSVLSEENIEEGYIKNKYIVPMILNFKFNNSSVIDGYYDSNVKVELLSVLINKNETIDYSEINKALKDIYENKEDSVNYTECGYLPNDYYKLFKINKPSIKSGIESESSCKNISMIVNYKGETSLSIRSLINDDESTSVGVNSKVTYKVLVQNNGTITSNNNVITSVIPKDLVYISDSVSDGGIYNKKNNTITWNIDSINPGEQESLTYRLSMPTEGDLTKVYKLSSSVKNSDKELIDSNKVSISLENLENPQTGDDRTYIVMIALIISCFAFIVLRGKTFIGNI